ILRIPQLGDVASFASDKPNKAKPPHIRQNLPPSGGTCEQSEQILPNSFLYEVFSQFKLILVCYTKLC
ncbi:hypothetical protein KJ664_02265, partial [Patescibacteria group bacterium]|nr:hypothetical protein [Patescibacteria group bacterium]